LGSLSLNLWDVLLQLHRKCHLLHRLDEFSLCPVFAKKASPGMLGNGLWVLGEDPGEDGYQTKRAEGRELGSLSLNLWDVLLQLHRKCHLLGPRNPKQMESGKLISQKKGTHLVNLDRAVYSG
jgi:hypothetical protein